jgi:hypothetical protein
MRRIVRVLCVLVFPIMCISVATADQVEATSGWVLLPGRAIENLYFLEKVHREAGHESRIVGTSAAGRPDGSLTLITTIETSSPKSGDRWLFRCLENVSTELVTEKSVCFELRGKSE